nr:DNA/RNA non-specific endonuclease [Enterococcus sp. DIV0849a]
MKPNNKYKAGEHDYNYKTDDLGRLEKAGPDELKPKTHDGRLPHNPNTPGKLPGDHAGHAFGDRFGGSPELNNLFSQSSKANLSDFKKIENSWAKALNQGKKVIAEVKANYSGTSPRPVSFEVKWSIDGVDFSQIIGN